MIGFFPILYDDELLHSAISRYHIRSGNISLKATLMDLFGSSTISSVVELPSNINTLIVNFPINSKHTSKEIIEKHTMFPFYTAFLPQKRTQLIRRSMEGNNGENVYNRIGIMASSIKSNKYLKFCPECFKEDKNRVGEAYWHRVHQIPGVYICSKHGIPLIDSEILLRSKNKHEFICATEKNCIKKNNITSFDAELVEETVESLKKILFSKNLYEKLCILSKNAELLINRCYNSKSSVWFWENYNNRLKEMGLANTNGQIHQKDFIQSFISFYGNDFLSLMQSNINIEDENNWLRQIVRKPRKVFYPIRHLLILQFLDISLDEIFNKKIIEKPFGDGPWACLNYGAEHYLEPVINCINISYDYKSKRPIGTFQCSCGFIYSRSGPDKNEEDRYKIGRIKAFGSVWEIKLKEMICKKLTLREMARRLKVDPKTIDKQAEKLGMDRYWKKDDRERVYLQIENEEKEEGKELLVKKYREGWLNLAKENSDMNKSQLRKLNEKSYSWLYRNDKDWIVEFKTLTQIRYIMEERIDWKKRDKEIVRQVQETINCILNKPGKPERVTISKVGKEIGKLSLLQKQMDKLPLTKEYLEKHTESVEDFQRRRIKWTIDELEKEGEEIKEWKVMRKAGIESKHAKMMIYIRKIIFIP